MKCTKEITLTLLLTSVALAGCNESPPANLLSGDPNKECSVVDQTDRCKEQRLNRLYNPPVNGYTTSTPPLNLGSTGSTVHRGGGGAFVYVPPASNYSGSAIGSRTSSTGISSVARGGFGASAAHFGGIGA